MAVGGGAIRAGRAFVELFAEDNKLYRALDRAKARLQGWGSQAARVGAAVGAAGGAILGPLGKAFADAAGRGNTLKLLADRFGVTTESVSALAYAFERNGSSLDDFAGTLSGLGAALSSAADGSDDTFRRLGLNARGLIRLPVTEALEHVIDALGRVTLAEDQAKFADAIGLGSMLPVIRRGAGALRELKAEAVGAGAVLSRDDAARSAEVMRTYTATWQALKYAALEAGSAILPQADTIRGLGVAVRDAVGSARRWLAENREVVQTAAAVGLGLAAAGAALAGVGVVAITAGAGIGALVAVMKVGLGLAATLAVGLWSLGKALVTVKVGATLAAAAKAVWGAATAGVTGLLVGLKVATLALFTPLGLLAAAVVGLGAYVVASIGPQVWEDLKGSVGSLLATFKTTWGGILDAVKAGDIGLAAKVGVAGLKAVWAEGMDFLTRQWVAFKGVVVDGWHQIGDLLEESLVGWQGLGVHITEGRAAAEAFVQGADAALADMRRQRDKDNAAFRNNQLAAARDELAAAKAELAARAREAADKAAGRGGEEPDDRPGWIGRFLELARKEAEEDRRRRPWGGTTDIAQAVKGAFSLPAAQQQFRYGDTAQRRIVGGVEKIAKDAGVLPDINRGIKDLAGQLQFK